MRALVLQPLSHPDGYRHVLLVRGVASVLAPNLMPGSGVADVVICLVHVRQPQGVLVVEKVEQVLVLDQAAAVHIQSSRHPLHLVSFETEAETSQALLKLIVCDLAGLVLIQVPQVLPYLGDLWPKAVDLQPNGVAQQAVRLGLLGNPAEVRAPGPGRRRRARP